MEVGGTLEKKRFICQRYWFGEEELTVCYLSYYLQAKFSRQSSPLYFAVVSTSDFDALIPGFLVVRRSKN